MIDPNLPMELDKGTPVVLNYVGTNGRSVNVTIPCSPRRDGKTGRGAWNYDLLTGIWIAGSAKSHYVLRNVINDASEMEYDV